MLNKGGRKDFMSLSERLRDFDLQRLILPIILFIVFIGAAIGIINYQQRNKASNQPKLEVVGPANGSTTQDAQIVVEGKTNPGDSVKVQGSDVPVDSKGQFAVEVPVNEGENSIGIETTNPAGKKTENTLKVTRVAAAPETVPGATTENNPPVPASGRLSTSGPEDFWLVGSLLLSGSITFWQLSRKKLNLALLA